MNYFKEARKEGVAIKDGMWNGMNLW